MNDKRQGERPEQAGRDRVIIRTSMIGIAANLVLAAFKAAVGLLSRSIAVVLDAVNNLSDALSSLVTIVGTKLAAKKPDKRHPLGYGRVEYLSAMIVASIVLYAGITSLVESARKLLHPETADYSAVSLVIIASAVVVKLLLGTYVKRRGESVHSDTLIASGSDALFDAILSASVLLSAVIFRLWGISLEAWVGVVISGFIIKAGMEILIDTLDDILGKRVDGAYLNEIKATICEDPRVSGAYDLILHSYGPEKYIGSVHIEVADTMTADEIDVLERHITQRVFMRHGVILGGISIYALNARDDAVKAMRSRITRLVMSHDGVLQIHGFYADTERKTIQMDVILDFALNDRLRVFSAIRDEVQAAYPEYTLQMALDIDA